MGINRLDFYTATNQEHVEVVEVAAVGLRLKMDKLMPQLPQVLRSLLIKIINLKTLKLNILLKPNQKIRSPLFRWALPNTCCMAVTRHNHFSSCHPRCVLLACWRAKPQRGRLLS